MVDLPAALPPPIQRMCRSRSGNRSSSRECRVTCVPYHPGNCEPACESLCKLLFKAPCSSLASRERDGPRGKDAHDLPCMVPVNVKGILAHAHFVWYGHGSKALDSFPTTPPKPEWAAHHPRTQLNRPLYEEDSPRRPANQGWLGSSHCA
jgi:hypothetical protein